MSGKSAGRTAQGGNDSVALGIVEALADAKGVSPTELDPLHDYVDLEALAAVVASGDDDLVVRWSVDGHRVEVDGTGFVRVL